MAKKIFERKPFNGFHGLAAVMLLFGLALAVIATDGMRYPCRDGRQR